MEQSLCYGKTNTNNIFRIPWKNLAIETGPSFSPLR